MDLDPIFLSRAQFAFTVSFHILFPTLTIGLGSYLAFLEARWLMTKNPFLLTQAKFWSKIFALTFGMGVVSGIVLSFEFGTNFAPFSTATGNVLGPLLSYEVLTAFFLEAGFLGVMLFGWNRVGEKMHFAATVAVAVGTLISSFWILSANSWMHTPQGAVLENGVFYPQDWWAIIFNPSFPFRLAHMVTAAFLTTAVFVTGVSALRILQGKSREFWSHSLHYGVFTLALLAPLQIIIGDLHGLNTFEHQPIKVAAMEGNWERRANVPLLLFAIPDQENATNHFEVGIPDAASWILTHTAEGEIPGLNEVPPEDRPYVPIVFWAFRFMVGIGFLFLFTGIAGATQAWRGRLLESTRLLKLFAFMTPLGFVAVLCGWWVTEVGRQPWTVQGLMRTRDSVSAITGGEVAMSLGVFVLLYTLLFGAYVYYMTKVIRSADKSRIDEGAPGAPARPAFIAPGEEE
ncbi:MAG: cytochrome ubiquinol oxidase subunit I [Proteobacteria bacterium]|nr:cytochrome ubiquinol oxidase subunit I [Pseudomonadota bacterium]